MENLTRNPICLRHRKPRWHLAHHGTSRSRHRVVRDQDGPALLAEPALALGLQILLAVNRTAGHRTPFLAHVKN